jgi:uncharacterized protein YndB with AHSA1/START domain
MDVDVDHHINAASRTVGARTLEAGEARVVTISRTYDEPIEDVWDALTNIERIPRWFLPITGELRVGGRYQLEGNAGGVVERCEPPRAFDATWEFGGGVSWIEARLAEEGDGTRFTLTHIAQVDDETWDQFGPGAAGIGWDGAVLGLSLHLATGAANDPAEAMAWSMTEQGIGFNRQSGERWHDADVAAGNDPEHARERADRAITAYTDFGGAPDT